MDRLALFAMTSAGEDHEDEASLGSDNLNSGASALSWMEDDNDSSNSGEDAVVDKEVHMLETLAEPTPKPRMSSGSGTASVKDELPAELEQPSDAVELQVHLPCQDISIHSKIPDFVGRKETLATIHQGLDQHNHGRENGWRSFALCGPGGVGKTQTALSYVFDVMEDFDIVLWAHATTQVQLIHSFSNFADQLGLITTKTGKEEDPTMDATLLKEWLNTTGKSLEALGLGPLAH